MPDITVADRVAIHETIALHGHLADDRAWDRLDEVFADDVVFDLTDYGYGTLHGLRAMRDLARGSRDAANQPMGHHVTNIVIVGQDCENVRVRSKALAVAADGTSASAVYEDVLLREPRGWRIGYRKVVARRGPAVG
ncbi:nuclear transport factor 2 family protein [Nocardia sp. bgisy118]|uniref:nuclear transport factor 2 family protein n=1 Tax=Nocardia sp. bgisy118 TaxID=3413786 RepID=UPI003F4A3D9D